MEKVFESFAEIFSKESERPHVELKESEIDVEYFLKQTKR